MRVPDDLANRLSRHGQSHLLRGWDELTEAEQTSFAAQLAAIDFDRLARLTRRARGDAADPDAARQRAERALPPRHMLRLPLSAEERARRDEAERRGWELLREGRVGAILVAGGQGSRLGFAHPKGMFPIGPVSNASLFQILAEQVLARSRRAGVTIPYCIMTSDATHAETVAFFEEHHFFGLDRSAVHFFTQGNMPAVDFEGRILLAGKGQVCESPDGHGGIFAALANSGLLDDMRARGIDFLDYHQVDNPTACVCDPVFLGAHAAAGSEMSTKVVRKRSPEERVGVVVEIDGRTQIIEYSDLPSHVAAKTDDRGQLLLWAGSTAMHVFNRDFLARIAADDSALPFHFAHKAVNHLDPAGQPVSPQQPNAVKFERFIFDAMPYARAPLAMEVDRRREFNPVKNADGNDSPATARAALLARAADWLRAAGARLEADARVEISPLFALDADELAHNLEPGAVFTGSVYLQ